MNLTERQQRVFDWLNSDLELPVFASVYLSAVTLMNTKPPGYITLVSHVGRDIMNMLGPTVEGVRGRVDYTHLVGEISNVWRDEWGGEGFTSTENGEDEIRLSFAVGKKIQILIDEHRAGRSRSNEASAIFFNRFLGYDEVQEIPKNFLEEWKSAIKFFLKYAHLREEDFVPGTDSDISEHFYKLDGLLYVAASKEYERMVRINELLEDANG